MPTRSRLLRRSFPARAAVACTALLVGAALWSSARAQATPSDNTAASLRLSTAQVQQAFESMDRDRDGHLSRAEAAVFPRMERHFERLDANQDGRVTPAEFEEAMQQAS